ncbi:MAG: hypothetical protein ACRDTP_01045, partial [Mycobacteriales bacterium]
VAFVTAILAEGERAPARGSGRHPISEPTRAGESRRSVEQLVSDSLLTDLLNISGTVLEGACEVLTRGEAVVSQQRAAVQGVLDAVNAEIARRYRDGVASVDALLADASSHD